MMIFKMFPKKDSVHQFLFLVQGPPSENAKQDDNHSLLGYNHQNVQIKQNGKKKF